MSTDTSIFNTLQLDHFKTQANHFIQAFEADKILQSMQQIAGPIIKKQFTAFSIKILGLYFGLLFFFTLFLAPSKLSLSPTTTLLGATLGAVALFFFLKDLFFKPMTDSLFKNLIEQANHTDIHSNPLFDSLNPQEREQFTQMAQNYVAVEKLKEQIALLDKLQPLTDKHLAV